MSEECNHNCESCSQENCGERDFKVKTNAYSEIKKIIGVISGKGGVGKSIVTSMLAVSMNRLGYKTAILDADITGPSIPKAFGIKEKASASEIGIFPVLTKTGIKVMSINLLLDNVTDPVIWRGPIIGNTVKQFYTDVLWNDVDYLFIDMPPGTGDVPLTVFQSIPVDGIIVVTSPQELVSMIVEKAVIMAEKMNVPILGIVENMSYFHCPDNNKDYQIFGESHIDEIAKKRNLKVLSKLPINPMLAHLCDQGAIEDFEGGDLDKAALELENLIEDEKEELKIALPIDNSDISLHFGHTEKFQIFTTEGKEIKGVKVVDAPEHEQGAIPRFLKDLGVNVVIASGMGEGALNLFINNDIEVVMGAKGNALEAVKSYLSGDLHSEGSACTEHAGEKNGTCSHHKE